MPLLLLCTHFLTFSLYGSFMLWKKTKVKLRLRICVWHHVCQQNKRMRSSRNRDFKYRLSYIGTCFSFLIVMLSNLCSATSWNMTIEWVTRDTVHMHSCVLACLMSPMSLCLPVYCQKTYIELKAYLYQSSALSVYTLCMKVFWLGNSLIFACHRPTWNLLWKSILCHAVFINMLYSSFAFSNFIHFCFILLV